MRVINRNGSIAPFVCEHCGVDLNGQAFYCGAGFGTRNMFMCMPCYRAFQSESVPLDYAAYGTPPVHRAGDEWRRLADAAIAAGCISQDAMPTEEEKSCDAGDE